MSENDPAPRPTDSNDTIRLDPIHPAVVRFYEWLLSVEDPIQELLPEGRAGKLVDELGFLDAELSPLMALQSQIRKFFSHGTSSASAAFAALYVAIQTGTSQVEVDTMLARSPAFELRPPWGSSQLAMALVLVHAAPANKTFNALKFQSELLGGVPSLAQVSNLPSASLEEAFKRAEARALGQERATTVIGVAIVDIGAMGRTEDDTEWEYATFGHTFVMGMGPEGVVIWQAWGPQGYSLDEYVKDERDKMQTWDEAGAFVFNFTKLVRRTGPWTAKINKLYKRCFGVDMIKLCNANGPLKPVSPKFNAWVRLHVIEDVKKEHVGKFAWRKKAN